MKLGPFPVFVDLEAKENVMESMRLTLKEQEDTQEQMDQVLEEKLKEIQELSSGEKQADKSKIHSKKIYGNCNKKRKGKIKL